MRILILGFVLLIILTRCVRQTSELPTEINEKKDDKEMTSTENSFNDKMDKSSQVEYRGDTILFLGRMSVDPIDTDIDFEGKFKDFEVSKRPIKNDYIKGQYDTIVSLKLNDDFLSYRHLTDKKIYLDISAHTNRIEFAKKIRIGLKKSEFYKRFAELDTLKILKNNVEIWGGFSSIKFTFQADTLAKVIFLGDVD